MILATHFVYDGELTSGLEYESIPTHMHFHCGPASAVPGTESSDFQILVVPFLPCKNINVRLYLCKSLVHSFAVTLLLSLPSLLLQRTELHPLFISVFRE